MPQRRYGVDVRFTPILVALLTPLAAHAHEVAPPEPREQPAPAWPDGRAAEHDVIVPVRLTVERDGTVSEATVEASVSPAFDDAALEAVRRWRFRPARDEHGAVRATVRAVVRFRGQPRAEPAAPEPIRAHEHRHDPAPEPDEPKPQTEPVRVTVRGTAPPRSASEVVRERDVLSAAPHNTASDLLTTVPGVFVSQHSGEGKAHQIFFRGFDAQHGQDVELWVAGAPVNEVSHVHGQGYADLHFVMPEMVRRITALPGTYAPQQGDFAVAGTMRFELGWGEPGFTARGTVGSFDTRRVLLAYHPEGESPESFAAFEARSTDGFGVARAAQRSSAIAQHRISLSEKTSVRLMASTYAGRFGSAGVVRRDDVESGAIDRFGSYDTDQGGHSTRTQVVAELRREDRDERLVLAPYLVRRSLRLRMNFTGFIRDETEGDRTEQTHDATTLGARGSYRRRLSLISERDELEVGFATRSDFIDQRHESLATSGNRITDTLIDAKVRATNVSGWADAAVYPVRRVALRGGARVDALSYAVDDEVAASNPRRSSQGTHVGSKATVDVALFPGVHALASYGEGFRSPQARSLGNGERTPFTNVQSAEVGVRYRDRQVAASLAGFRTTLSDDVVFDETTTRNDAVPGTERIGVAGDFTARARPWFSSALGFTYTRATFSESGTRFEKGDTLPYVPVWVLRSDMRAEHELGKVGSRPLVGRVGAGTSYLYRRPIPFGEFGDDVFLVDARAAVRLREVELDLEVMNLFDATWWDGEFVYVSNFQQGGIGSRVPARHSTAGAPRTIMLSLALYV